MKRTDDTSRTFSRRSFALSFPAALFGKGCSRSESVVSADASGFGTEISITLPETADREIFDKAFAEVARLDALFTLFDPASPLRRLNDTGHLSDPPSELIEIFSICETVHGVTGGAFDPTVQPLWELYERHFAENPTDTAGPDPAEIAEARSRIGWGKVEWSRSEIRFREPGMALTLNGIAPGFAADRIADWLEERGLAHALVNTGEFRALGTRPDGDPWRVDIRAGEKIVAHAELEGNALATSAGDATAFDLAQKFHHLFHPGRDTFQPAMRTISVEAPEAAMADALATAGGIMEQAAFESVVAELPEVRTRFFDH